MKQADAKPDLLPNVTAISAELMNSSVANLSMIVNEVVETSTYNSMDDFLAHGIGYALVVGNKVYGFCTSEYPSQKEIAIGIEVLPEYQRQGYAKAMVQFFLKDAAGRDLCVYWDCWKGNIASANTAMSCGLAKIADYPVIYLNF